LKSTEIIIKNHHPKMDSLKNVAIGVGIGLALSAYINHGE